MTPFPTSVEGLIKIAVILVRLRDYLSKAVIDPWRWIVTQWHYGRDAPFHEMNIRPFCWTFKTWSETLARVYYSRETNRVRAEIVDKPNKSLEVMVISIVNHFKGGELIN